LSAPHLFCPRPPGGLSDVAHFHNAQDSFNYWNNWVDSVVRAQGKTLHAWAEALVSITPAASSLNTDIVLQFWTSGPTPALTRGNYVVNANRGVLYYVLGAGSYKFSPSTAYDWDPSKFSGETIAPLHPLNLGAHASIWCDNPKARAGRARTPITNGFTLTWGQRSPSAGCS
jgi:hypothetical protein